MIASTQFTVLPSSLAELDQIWSLALYVDQAITVQNAIHLLVSLYFGVSGLIRFQRNCCLFP